MTTFRNREFNVEALESRILLSATPVDQPVFDEEDNLLATNEVILMVDQDLEQSADEASLFEGAEPVLYKVDTEDVDDDESVEAVLPAPVAMEQEASEEDAFFVPELPGLVLENGDPAIFEDQIIYLDFSGLEGFDYSGPIVLENLTLDAFQLPVGLDSEEGLTEEAVIASILAGVQSIFGQTGLKFVSGTDPPAEAHSVIHIGGTNEAFVDYGRFYGLAEAVDLGNLDRTDRAFVFSDSIAADVADAGEWMDRLTTVVAHETGRLLGYENAPGYGGTGPLSLVANEAPAPEPERPVFVIPGIVGTFAAPGHEDEWFTTRGIHPDKLMLDPLAGLYDDVVATLINSGGYVEGETLFVANYDWRLPVGPVDNSDASTFDGSISGITETTMTDGVFEYAVDYLGYWLDRAKEAWMDLTGTVLEAVDVIAHSTGGLVARTFLQSDAYPDEEVNDEILPAINDLFMIGVPNEGASKPWNALANNFANDVAYRTVISKIAAKAY